MTELRTNYQQSNTQRSSRLLSKLARERLEADPSLADLVRRQQQAGVVWEEGVRARMRQIYEQKAHPNQDAFINSLAKRKIVRAGRRGGKTVGVARLAVRAFLAGRRILYGTPTQDQINRFWTECKRALEGPLSEGILYKNETEHVIELPGTEQRIRAKTAWNADTLRGDYADLLILDEFQLMHEETWGVVGAPMLLDNDGDAVFVYTPPSLRSIIHSRATDPYHVAKLYKKAKADESGRWAAFHFTSHDNPYISPTALSEITSDMTALAYEQEILAEDKEDVPGALWTRKNIEGLRVTKAPDLFRVVTAIDPSATETGDEAGIVTAGSGWCSCKGKPEIHAFVLSDDSVQAHPSDWARGAVTAFHKYKADSLIAESNNGGQMVSVTIGTIPGAPRVRLITASRGKHTRAEPISLLYEQGMVHHVGVFASLESEQCSWVPGMPSPNRMDALVWALTELQLGGTPGN